MSPATLYTASVISGFLSFAPAIAAWCRLPVIRAAYYPFIVLLSANAVAELVSIILVHYHRNNTAWFNVYALVSLLLVAWQLLNWAPSRCFALCLKIISAALGLVWVLLYYRAGTLMQSFTLFLLLKPVALCLLCFYLLYHRLPNSSFGIYKDATVIICAGWLMLFAYMGITELMMHFSAHMPIAVGNYLWGFFTFFNILVLILHLIAVLWIPPKTPSS